MQPTWEPAANLAVTAKLAVDEFVQQRAAASPRFVDSIVDHRRRDGSYEYLVRLVDRDDLVWMAAEWVRSANALALDEYSDLCWRFGAPPELRLPQIGVDRVDRVLGVTIDRRRRRLFFCCTWRDFDGELYTFVDRDDMYRHERAAALDYYERLFVLQQMQ